MKTIANLLWIFLGGGIIIAAGYLFSGLLLCLTIVGIPFGVQVIRLAGFSLVPFGKEVKPGVRAQGCLPLFMNILWILIGGFWIALAHVLFAVLLVFTIIGIPFAQQHIKLAGFAFTPFGYTISR